MDEYCAIYCRKLGILRRADRFQISAMAGLEPYRILLEFTRLDLSPLLARSVMVTHQHESQIEYLHGRIQCVIQNKHSQTALILAPLYELSVTPRCQLFTESSLKKIIKQLLSPLHIAINLDFIDCEIDEFIQFNETNLACLQRLMQHYDCHYQFSNLKNICQLVFTRDQAITKASPSLPRNMTCTTARVVEQADQKGYVGIAYEFAPQITIKRIRCYPYANHSEGVDFALQVGERVLCSHTADQAFILGQFNKIKTSDQLNFKNGAQLNIDGIQQTICLHSYQGSSLRLRAGTCSLNSKAHLHLQARQSMNYSGDYFKQRCNRSMTSEYKTLHISSQQVKLTAKQSILLSGHSTNFICQQHLKIQAKNMIQHAKQLSFMNQNLSIHSQQGLTFAGQQFNLNSEKKNIRLQCGKYYIELAEQGDLQVCVKTIKLSAEQLVTQTSSNTIHTDTLLGFQT